MWAAVGCGLEAITPLVPDLTRFGSVDTGPDMAEVTSGTEVTGADSGLTMNHENIFTLNR